MRQDKGIVIMRVRKRNRSSIVAKSVSGDRTIWDVSPLSPPWTTAVVLVVIILFTIAIKISLSG